MSYNKITENDLVGKGVVGQPDTPALSALEMQNKVEEIVRDVVIPAYNSLIDSIAEDFGNTYSKDEVEDAIARTITEIGAGDMAKAIYDTDGDGVVDNAAKLGGNLPGDYMPAKEIAYNAETIDSLTTFAMRNSSNTATDSLSVACKEAYDTALWFMFSIAQPDACVQYAFPYGTKNGFLMRNYNWWTKSWSSWESVVPASGGGLSGGLWYKIDPAADHWNFKSIAIVNSDWTANGNNNKVIFMIRK